MAAAAGCACNIISLVDPGLEFRPPAASASLVLRLHDIAQPQPGRIEPNERQVAALLAFARAVDPDLPLIVHCHVGINRSTAAALAILADHGLAPAAAIAEVLRIRPRARPNLLIAQLADDALDLGGTLAEAAARLWP